MSSSNLSGPLTAVSSAEVYEVNKGRFFPHHNVKLPKTAVKSAQIMIAVWRKKMQLVEIPLVIAVNGSMPKGKLEIFSIDRAPLGLELLNFHQPDFQRKLFVAKQESLIFKNSPLFKEREAVAGSHDGGHRSFPDHPKQILQEQSDKIYGPSYNNQDWPWRKVYYQTYENLLDLDGGFSLRAIEERRLYVCPPKNLRQHYRRAKIEGRRTVSQMLRNLQIYKTMYYQPFIQPMEGPNGQPMIYSLYFIYDCWKDCYVYGGGLTISRKSLNVVIYGDGLTLGLLN